MIKWALIFWVLIGISKGAEPISFQHDVRPILSDKCFKCHGPDAANQKSEFRIDTFTEAIKEHNGAVGIAPKDVENSEVFWRIHSDDPADMMPPPDSNLSLTEQEKKIIEQWIEQGAKYEKHWSFVKLPAKVAIPDPINGEHSEFTTGNPIDNFIANKLVEKNLQPAAETSPEKWLRRVYFDLTGLPPSLEQLDQFLAKPTEEARSKVLDQLLNSSAYAERMTAEWLDVARYSDSYGYQVDRNREVWPWRDWVIQAFKDNLSYDQFVTWQVAGDLLPNATKDQILATTFNRLHSQKVEGGSVEEEFRIEYVADRVHTFGTAFLGMTMECTRCHDHKYDPLTAKDYFSLSAFFNNIDESGLYAFFTSSVPTPTLDLPTDAQAKQLTATHARVERLEKELASIEPNKSPATKQQLFTGNIVHLDFESNQNNQYNNLADPTTAAKTVANNKVVTGKLGNGVQLTGDHAINLPKGIGNFTRDQPFSLALWVNPSINHERAVVVRRSKAWTDAGSRGYELLIENGKLSAALIHFWPGNAIRIRAKQAIKLNHWQHVSITYDGSSRASGLQLYIDGELAEVDIVRDNLSREIVGGGDDFVALGQRMRDKGFKNGSVDEFYVFDRQISPLEVKLLHDREHQASEQERIEHDTFLLPSVIEKQQALRKAREARSRQQKSIRQIMVMQNRPGERRTTHLLNRGMYDDPGIEVQANTPAILPPLKKQADANRLDLANWLTDPEHPLFARVTVNRYWQMMFGRGLVATPEDFGSQSKSPSHPELLDWLARDFIDHDWNLHHLLKQIALSQTYRQSSVVTQAKQDRDPENIWLSRGPSYKLAAEMIRDNALAVSGLLTHKVGGPSVKPYDLAVSFKPMKPESGPNLYRRSVYTYWKRTSPSPMMMTLDSSKKDVCRVKREETASPLQSLVLLNSPQFVEAARVAAEKLLKLHGDDDAELIKDAFRLLTSRHADKREMAILLQLLIEQVDVFTNDLNAADQYFKTGAKAPAQPTDKARLAAVTVLVSTLMNFDESITKR